MEALFRVLSGALLLCFGRRLFWLFVGLLGFFAAFGFASKFFSEQSQLVTLTIALVAGLIGILLAIFLQRVAIAVAGFLAGGMFAVELLQMTGWQIHPSIAYIVCGVIGAILISILFDGALILLSSLIGAMLITRSLTLQPLIEAVLIAVLVVIGILIQSRLLQRRPVERTT
jgi:hypothetical protein